MSIRLAATLLCAACTACSSMLPRGSTDTPSPFETFAQAQAAAEQIVPFRTRTDELRALGFDPHEGRNVTLIPYPDIVARLAPHPGVPIADLDPGIRRCIGAGKQCRGLLFRFQREDRKREGGFWADFFNVRRVTNITGWWFEALVVVSDDTVLFRNVAGEARIDRVEKQTNPLGPLQDAGEAAGSALIR